MARGRKQDSLPAPGMERDSIPEIDEAALEYVAARDERMRRAVEEKKKYEALVGVLKRHNLEHYRFDTDDGVTMSVDKVAVDVKVKVKKVKGDGDEPAEDKASE